MTCHVLQTECFHVVLFPALFRNRGCIQSKTPETARRYFLNSETKVQIQRRSQENVQSECRFFISFCLVLGVPHGAGGHMQTRIAPLTNQ